MDLHNILMATDFSPCSAAAFQMAKKLASNFGAKIILLHVVNQRLVEQLALHLQVDDKTLWPEFKERAESQLAGVKAQLIAARNGRARALLDLARALNLPLDTPLALTDSLDALVDV
ncbi:MAG: hypothetical protein B7Z74_06185, partial [Deltaproteobacteria bacterium 21-66-5]